MSLSDCDFSEVRLYGPERKPGLKITRSMEEVSEPAINLNELEFWTLADYFAKKFGIESFGGNLAPAVAETAKLLYTYGDDVLQESLDRCPNCLHIFPKHRTNQQYCGRKCADAKRQRRYRSKHG